IFSPRSCGKLLHSISVIVLHVLDALLLIILLPFMLWQWISANDRLKLILRAIVEVTLELIMWVIFAGVSILMTATFVVEDGYFRKNDEEKLRRLLNETTINYGSVNDNKDTRILETESLLKEKEKLKIPDNGK
ncbi:uncharacterized protein LOC143188385, partial [Calliopsis andreniformis]|uniref:uncharacterized protein LOC143188385 n=1 Tax=Calliopsis andreniformis TaxID=337506 RepID=UPI003FCD42C6